MGRLICNYKKCNLIPRLFQSKYAFSTNSENADLELNAGYVPHELVCQKDEYFKPPIKDCAPFTMILPPPNITGTLHLGHALTATIEDILIRWKSMKGIKTLWVPGIDHAGIATQVVVEKNLWKTEKKMRQDIGREAFKRKLWEWKENKADIIWRQLQQLNISLDWERAVFTLDKKHIKSVEVAFIRLFQAGLIYRADRLVNWSCVLQSTISDIEIEHLALDGPTQLDVPGYENPVEFGTLLSFAYKLKDSEEEIIVTTTRPETLIGDVAVAVHPDDQRYTRLIGCQLWHPFRNEFIPIVADRFVDPDFGTGAVKITPAHDNVDFDVGLRHNLPVLNVIDEAGHLTSICGQLHGVRRFDARKIIIEELAKKGLYRGKSDKQMTVPICSRSKDVVELLVKSQWFIKSEEMAARAINDVRDGKLKIVPNHFENTWFSWLENIRDWCISRQLWWGQQVPAYKCYQKENPENHIWVAAEDKDVAFQQAALKFGSRDFVVVRDEDVLDTWFSSALLPMSVFGWPQRTDDLKSYYPLSLLETGHDILFFWAARMVLLGNELMGQLPFNNILLHGIICDSQGRKMSKSRGNVITPGQIIEGMSLKDMEKNLQESHTAGILSDVELSMALQAQGKIFPNGIPECGSDALRFTLVSHNIKSNFIHFDVSECYNNKLFGNKLWQATKFLKTWFDNVSNSQRVTEVKLEKLTKMDRWILSRLSKMVTTVDEAIEDYDFHIATNKLKGFLYYDFCDIYLESTKSGLRNTQNRIAVGHCFVLHKCLDIGLRTLAPFMPTLASHLHKRLPSYYGYGRSTSFPEKLEWHDIHLENDIRQVMELVVAVRRMKKLFNVTAKHEPKVYIYGNNLFWDDYSGTVKAIAGCHEVIICNKTTKNMIPNGTVKDTVGDTSYYLLIPEQQRQSVKIDIKKMDRKMEKLLNEMAKMSRMTSGNNYNTKVSLKTQEAHSKKISSLQNQINRIQYMKKLLENMADN